MSDGDVSCTASAKRKCIFKTLQISFACNALAIVFDIAAKLTRLTHNVSVRNPARPPRTTTSQFQEIAGDDQCLTLLALT